MLPLWEAVFLAVVQGLTEFVPVSSSGHLVLLPAILGLDEPGLPFVVAVHVGTLLAVLAYYWRDWRELFIGLLAAAVGQGGRAGDVAHLWALLAVGTLPAAIAGAALESKVERVFNNPALACGALFLTGLVLLAADRARGRVGPSGTGWWQALIVGVGQAVAIVPGISRSGMTIACGLAVGLERQWAVRYAFLLSAPIIAGAGVLEAAELARQGLSASEWAQLGMAMAISAAAGLAAIHLVVRAVARRRLWVFAAYCFAAAGVAGAILLARAA